MLQLDVLPFLSYRSPLKKGHDNKIILWPKFFHKSLWAGLKWHKMKFQPIWTCGSNIKTNYIFPKTDEIGYRKQLNGYSCQTKYFFFQFSVNMFLTLKYLKNCIRNFSELTFSEQQNLNEWCYMCLWSNTSQGYISEEKCH